MQKTHIFQMFKIQYDSLETTSVQSSFYKFSAFSIFFNKNFEQKSNPCMGEKVLWRLRRGGERTSV